MWTNSNILNRTQTNRNRMNQCYPRQVTQNQKFNFIPLNAYESEQYYTLDFALAGFVKSEISIKIEDQVLKILATPAQTSNELDNEGRTSQTEFVTTKCNDTFGYYRFNSSNIRKWHSEN